MKTTDIETVIRTFTNLQTQLVGELKRTLGPRDWHYLTDVPRKGNISINDTPWQYKVHGTGVRFSSAHGTVDMNRNLDGDPSLFDAGRLAEYLSSIGQKSVVWADRVVEFDYDHGPSILREMHATGALQRAEFCDGELYRLPSQ